MRDLFCLPSRPRALHLLAALICVVACSSSARPPAAKVAPTFHGFVVGRDADAAWKRALLRAQGERAEPLAAGPRAAALLSDGLSDNGDYVARFDGPLCPAELGVLRTGEEAVVVHEQRDGAWVPVPGETRWRSDRSVAFQAATPWSTATRYRMALPEQPCADATILPGEGGEHAAREHVFDPIEIYWAGNQSRPDKQDFPLPANEPAELWVNHPVTLLDLGAAIVATAKVAGEPERVVPVAVAGKRDQYGELVAGVFTVSPADAPHWPAGARMHFAMDPALRSSAGPAPLGSETPVYTRSIRAAQTFVPRCARGCDPSDDLVLSTTRSVPEGALAQIRVSPRVKGLAVSEDAPYRGNRGQLRLAGRIQPNTDYQITFPAGFPDAEGGALASEVVVDLSTTDVTPYLAFDTERERREYDDWAPKSGPAWNHDYYEDQHSLGAVHVLQSSRPMTVGVMGRRVTAFEVRVSAVDDAEIGAWVTLDRKPASLPAATEVARKTISVRPKGSTAFVSHALDLRALVGDRRGLFVVEIEATNYLRGAPATSAGPQRLVVLLSDLGPAVASSPTRTTLHLRELSSDAPVADAAVKLLTSATRALRPLGRTDAQGELEVRTREPLPPGPSFLIIDAPSGDRTVLEMPAESYGDGDAPPGALTELGEAFSGVVAVERGIYRPGETVHVLGWSVLHTPWSPHRVRELPEGTQMRVWMEHGRLGTLAYQNVTTGAHGKFSADFELPEEIISGRLSVHAQAVDDASGGYVRAARARVEDFRIPTFWVSTLRERAGAEQGAPLGSRRARFSSTAQAYSGGPVPVVDAHVTHSCSLERPSSTAYGLPREWIVGERGMEDVSAAVESTLVAPPSDRDPAREGRVEFELEWPVLPAGKLLRCELDASLMDNTLQAYSDSAYIHELSPGAVVAVQTEQYWEPDQAQELRVRAQSSAKTRLAMAGVRVRVLREEVVEVDGQRSEDMRHVEVARCELELSAEGEDAACVVPPVERGTYVVEVAGPDTAKTSTRVYALPRSERWDAQEDAAPEDVPQYESLCDRTASGESCTQVELNPGFSSSSAVPELSVNPLFDHVRVGDSLAVALRGPWRSAHGVLLVGEAGHLGRVPFHMREGRAELRLEVNEQWVGGVELVAWLPRSGKSKLPSFEAASSHVSVSTASRTLKVEIGAASRAEAGDTLPIEIDVHDRDGRAAPGRVSLWMVDKAVLDLTRYRVPSIAPQLLPNPEAYSRTVTYYDEVRAPFVVRSEDPGGWGMIGSGGLGLMGKGHGGGSGSGHSSGTSGGHDARDRFAITPLFLADVALDAQGHAEASVTLPGNLTTFTIMAVATDALRSAGAREDAAPARFGRAQHQVQVDVPFSVRIAAPRYLRAGDRVQLGATLVNRSEQDEEVRVEVSVQEGPLALMGSQTQRVSVPAGARRRVNFDAVAGTREGEIALRMAVRNDAGTVDDAEQRVIELRHERLREQSDAFAGTLEAVPRSQRGGRAGALRVPIELPKHVDPQQVHVSVDLASSALVQLGRNITMLSRYPYGCTEQTSSAMLMSLAVSGPRMSVLFPDQRPRAHIEAAIHRLVGRERGDGTFSYWPGSASFHAWASVQATWVLLLARDAGFVVPDDILERALERLHTELARASTQPKPADLEPPVWDPQTRAFAAFVLADTHNIELHDPEQSEEEARLLGEQRRQAIADALDALDAAGAGVSLEREALRAYTLARLAPPDFDARAAVSSLERGLSFHDDPSSAISDTGSVALAHPASLDVALADNFTSTARATALVLIAVLELDGDAQLVDALAAGLLFERERGHWGTTQANAFALIALERWAARREGQGAAVDAEVWLSRRRILEATLSHAKRPSARNSGPLRIAKERGRPSLTLSARGQGRVYYQAVLTRQRDALHEQLPPDRRLHLSRVLRDHEGERSAVAAGDLLALDILLEAETDTRYVAVDVPLPAGLEVISTTLASQAKRMPLAGERGEWVSHVSFEKDRVVVFADELEAGTHLTTVFVRATAAGDYDWPRARAQAMYMPEVAGWSAGGSLEIRPRD